MERQGTWAGRKINFLLAFLMGAFVCYAIYVVLFGTLSTTMMDHYGIGTGAQGVFTMVGSIGGIAAALFCALCGERFSKLWAVAVGALLLGISALAVGFAPPYLLVCVCAFGCGVGYTVIDVMGNAAVTEYFPGRTRTLLPMVQILFGVGTMVGPFLATSLLVPGAASSFTSPFLLVGGASIAVTLVYSLALRRAAPLLPALDLQQMAASARQNPAAIFRSWKSWAVLASCSLFCCFNTSVVAWYPALFSMYRGMDADGAALMLTLFYVGILAMRVVSPLLFKKMQPQRVYVLFSFLSVGCMLAAINTPMIPLAILFTLAGGAFQSLNVVCVIMIATALFPERKASASSLAIFAYNIGGMTAPVLVGVMAETMGLAAPLSIMCGVFAAGVCIMAFVSRRCRAQLGGL